MKHRKVEVHGEGRKRYRVAQDGKSEAKPSEEGVPMLEGVAQHEVDWSSKCIESNGNHVYSSAQAVIRKYLGLSGLHNRTLFFYNVWGWTFEVRVLEWSSSGVLWAGSGGGASWLSYSWLLCLHMTEGLSVFSFTFQMFLIVVKVT